MAAAVGEASVTISFDSWADGHVSPTTHTVSVIRPKARVADEPVSSRLIRSLVHPERTATIAQVQFSTDGTRLFTAGYPSGMLQFWDVASGQELRRIATPSGGRSTAEYAGLT